MVSAHSLTVSVRRVAAAADRTLDEGTHPVSRQAWDAATAVVLDSRAADACAGRMPRRRRVVLLCEGSPGLEDWKRATAVGAEHVLGVPADEGALVTILGERPERPDADGTVVAVLGGCGGAGASTMAAALALTAAEGRRKASTLLVDLDVLGSGSDVLLGIEDRPGLRWPGLTLEAGRVSAAALRDALPARGDALRVLASGALGKSAPTAGAARAVVDAGRRAGDLVVCDLARSASAATDAILEIADMVALVVPATVRACIAAEKVAAWASERNPNQGLVVRGPAPGGLRAADIADVLGLPLLASMRADRALTGMLEHGGLRLGRRSPLAAAAESVLDVVNSRPRTRWAS